MIAAGTRSTEFVPCDPALAARAVLGALNWSVRWFRPEGSMTAAEIAEGFADYLIRGLLTKPDALQRAASSRGAPKAIRSYLSREMKTRAVAR